MLENWTIKNIERLRENEVQEMAMEKTSIKKHDVYFVNLGIFGLSALVFLNHHHVYYANDYELHHLGLSEGDLKGFYIYALNNRLFTEEEIVAPLTSYDEYIKKRFYVYNYYGMQEDGTKIFDESSKHGMTYNPVCRQYYDNKDFVKRHIVLREKLEREHNRKFKANFDYIKDAFKYEMANHEYYCNWEADYDTLQSFGVIAWRGDDENALMGYFDDLCFADIQRDAYYTARDEYYRERDYY